MLSNGASTPAARRPAGCSGPSLVSSTAYPNASMATQTRYSLIIPVYRNEETLDDLLAALRVLAGDLDHKLEVVFVVDGSPDRSYPILQERLPTAGFPSQLISLSRNFGSFAAIRMGLEAARG